MIRVLHIMGCADAGGISSVVRYYYQFMDRTQFHFDIALTVPEAGQNARALEQMGARIFFVPLKSQDPEGFRREVTRLLAEGQYDALHVHESETCYVALRIAKQMGIPCRIAHAHTSSPYEGIRSVFRRLSGCMLNYGCSTHVIACGELAGRRVFGRLHMRGKKALVLPNAVDTQRFRFDPQIRTQVRRELHLEDQLVLGMVARLSPEKNVAYGLDVLAALGKQEPRSMLVIAGDGEEAPRIREKIRQLGLEDRTLLLGKRADVERLYQAFDVCLLPSIHEGFPVVAVEALAAGLPVLLSDTITGELKGFPGTAYLPLRDPSAWAEQILRAGGSRTDTLEPLRKANLDIRTAAKLLEQIYREDTGKDPPKTVRNS